MAKATWIWAATYKSGASPGKSFLTCKWRRRWRIVSLSAGGLGTYRAGPWRTATSLTKPPDARIEFTGRNWSVNGICTTLDYYHRSHRSQPIYLATSVRCWIYITWDHACCMCKYFRRPRRLAPGLVCNLWLTTWQGVAFFSCSHMPSSAGKVISGQLPVLYPNSWNCWKWRRVMYEEGQGNITFLDPSRKLSMSPVVTKILFTHKDINIHFDSKSIFRRVNLVIMKSEINK